MSRFQVRNLELEIIQYVSHTPERLEKPRPIDAPGYNMVVFDVVDLDAAREKLIAAGGTVESDVEGLHGGDMFFGRDIDGNLLGFQVASADIAVSAQNFKDNGI